MTKEEAIALHETKFWETMNYRDRAMFQMFEPKLCMPFGVFHEAMEKTLGRPIQTIEFGPGADGLKAELLGEKQAPTFDDILDLIPHDKRIVIIAQ